MSPVPDAPPPAHLGLGRTHRRVLALALAVLAALAVVTALFAGPRLLARSPASDALPDSRQVLRDYTINSRDDMRTLDPARVISLVPPSASAYTPVALIFPGLLTLDDHLQPVPWAAAAMPTINVDGATYLFTLRPGLRWSDGSPIDASVFAYSINRALDPCTYAPMAPFLYPIKDAAAFNAESCPPDHPAIDGPIQSLIGDSLIALDPLHLQITLARPAAYFLEALAFPISYAQPRQLIERYGPQQWIDHLADNSGFGGSLYKVTRWHHPTEYADSGMLVLDRNAGFWGAPPRLREIQFASYRTPPDEYRAYKGGALDVGEPPQDTAAAAAPNDVNSVPALDTDFFMLNWRAPPFDDVRARQAFALALDKVALAQQVAPATLVPTNHIVPLGNPGYNPALVGPDGTQSLRGNPALAQQLITSYAHDRCPGGDIRRCPPVTFAYTDDPTVAQVAQAALPMWQHALPSYPVTAYPSVCCGLLDAAYHAEAPQFSDFHWSADYPDPQDWLTMLFGPNLGSPTGDNYYHVHSPAADALMASADAASAPAVRYATYAQAEQTLVTQVAAIPLFQHRYFYATLPALRGYTLTPYGYPTLATWQRIYLAQP